MSSAHPIFFHAYHAILSGYERSCTIRRKCSIFSQTAASATFAHLPDLSHSAKQSAQHPSSRLPRPHHRTRRAPRPRRPIPPRVPRVQGRGFRAATPRQLQGTRARASQLTGPLWCPRQEGQRPYQGSDRPRRAPGHVDRPAVSGPSCIPLSFSPHRLDRETRGRGAGENPHR
jgi:hypothetical protein